MLRGAIPKALLERACARLSYLVIAPELAARPVVNGGPVPILEVFGRSLRLAPWNEYAPAIPRVRALHAELFEAADGLESLLSAAVARLGGGAPTPLLGAEGAAFAPALVTTLRAGAEIPFHFDNYCFHEDTAFVRAGSLLSQRTLLNALLLIEAPEAGGGLELAAFDWDEYVQRTARRDSGAWSDTLVDDRARTRVDLAAGDLLIFDAGRIAHRVTPVEGRAPRRAYVWHMGTPRGSDALRYFV